MVKRTEVDPESLEKLQKKRESLDRVMITIYREPLFNVMASPLYTCLPETIISVALQKMAEKNISSIVIVDGNSTPIGILTERDVLKRIATDTRIGVRRELISSVMTEAPFTLTHED